MSDIVFRVIGIIMIVIGILGLLALLGELNPLAVISNALLGFTNQFLSETASYILWFLFIILGLTLVGPREGYAKRIVEMRK